MSASSFQIRIRIPRAGATELHLVAPANQGHIATLLDDLRLHAQCEHTEIKTKDVGL